MKTLIALVLAALGFVAGCGATKKIVINTETSALAGRIEREINSTVTVATPTTATITNATLDHVGGHVASIDLEASLAQWREEPPGSAARIQDGTSQVPLVKVDFRRVEIDKCPVVGN